MFTEESGGAPDSSPYGVWPEADPIVETAVMCFARRGFSVPVREIASAAGVSAALLIKRFGSKDGLRRQCDEVVLERIRIGKQHNMASASAGGLLASLAESDRYAPLIGYTMHSVREGGDLGREFIEHMIADAVEYTTQAVAQGVVKPSRDEAARARHLVLSAMGSFMLTLALDPPDDPQDLPALMRRLSAESTLPMLELFSEGLFTTRRMLDDYLLTVPDPPAASSPAPADDDPAGSEHPGSA